jgi:1,4-dihydroxy-2-naphthoate polyprenyltransferase
VISLRAVAAFVRLGRPLFLVGGFLAYGLGAAMAVVLGAPLDLRLYLAGQVAVTALQLMTHYCNDHFDLEADRLNATPTRWSGGSRVLTSGALPPHAALLAAVCLAGGGLGATLALGAHHATGPLVVPALIATLVLAWSYSAPPLRLHSTGWGELNVAVVVTGLVPFVGFHLQAPGLEGIGTLLLALVPPALLQLAMVIAVAFPDVEGDATAGKRTLVVRLGVRRAAVVYAAVTTLAFAVLPLLVWAGLPTEVARGAAAPAPFALWRVWRALRGDVARPTRFETVTFWAVALFVATTAFELAALVFASTADFVR